MRDKEGMTQLVACQRQMQRHGVRRLLVISGDATWSAQQARQIAATTAGDWLWISPDVQSDRRTVSPESANQLLGQAFLHGVFDARQGLNVEALAAFSGVLQAGSWLLLLVPDWQNWPTTLDLDSRRWSEQPDAIATPRFIQRFCREIHADPQALVWRQEQAFTPRLLTDAPHWQPPHGEPTRHQQAILDRLLQAEDGVWVLTAARGRGKSTLSGMLVQQWPGRCWLTAPSRASGSRLEEQSGQGAMFWAPDALLAHLEQGNAADADWLLIDEAAAIPTPLLSRLIAFFPRVLLTTTVQGYEGTGRGFVLKFCASLPNWQDLRLTAPIRWAEGDPLETLLDKVLLFNEPDPQALPPNDPRPLRIEHFTADLWTQYPARLEAFYHLLTRAHYRTSPLDLRRLLDAPGMSFSAALRDEDIAAALWLVDEGGLDAALAHEVWAGRRRPRGNLVAQSLAAHGGFASAAVMSSRRITRIAVTPASRRQGIASALVAAQRLQAAREGRDYLSVSFGFTPSLWHFWQHCGFRMVRVGNQREASSGCYAAMAMLPLSDAGTRLCDEAVRQFTRNARQIPADVARCLVDGHSQPEAENAPSLEEADWRELAGFAFASRALDSSQSALCRLLSLSPLPLPALRARLELGLEGAAIVAQCKLSGKKALLKQYRDETRQALQHLDASQTSAWQRFAQPAASP